MLPGLGYTPTAREKWGVWRGEAAPHTRLTSLFSQAWERGAGGRGQS